MHGDDPVDLVRQEDEVGEGNGSLDVPLGVRDDRVAPLLARVEVDAVLEAWAAVGEGGERRCEVVPVWQKHGADLEIIHPRCCCCFSVTWLGLLLKVLSIRWYKVA